MEEDDRLLGTKEVAARLGVDQSRVRQLALDGVLVAQKLGRDWFVRQADLAAYEAKRPPRGRPRTSPTPPEDKEQRG